MQPMAGDQQGRRKVETGPNSSLHEQGRLIHGDQEEYVPETGRQPSVAVGCQTSNTVDVHKDPASGRLLCHALHGDDRQLHVLPVRGWKHDCPHQHRTHSDHLPAVVRQCHQQFDRYSTGHGHHDDLFQVKQEAAPKRSG